LFKKIFVADNLGIIVDKIYSNPSSGGFEYMVATWAFAFQIYGDFLNLLRNRYGLIVGSDEARESGLFEKHLSALRQLL